MKISFDLDGVIADTDKWFFKLLDMETNKDLLRTMELDYYSSRPLKSNPNKYLSCDDVGYIVTARKPHSECVTDSWLDKHCIKLPIIYVDGNNDIDWSDYENASIKAGEKKLKVLLELKIDIHFDNNPHIVDVLRKSGIKAILINF